MRTLHILLAAATLATALAGCTNDPASDSALPTDSSPAPGGFAPQEGRQEASDERVSLVAELTTCDAGWCIDATATNEGSDALQIEDGTCMPPWSESMEQAGSEVPHREPTFHCQAFILTSLDAGAETSTSTAWDGRIWDDDQGRMMDGAGEFQWTLSFTYFEGDDGDGRHTLSVTFPVIVGES